MKLPNGANARAVLQHGVDALSLELSEVQIGQFLRYVELLIKWNKSINLTSIRTPDEAMVVHVLDCLAATPYIYGKRVACIGSGGGTPGLIWAIVDTRIEVTLVEPRSKRAQFLNFVIAELQIDNAQCVNERSEQFNPSAKFDTLTCRALGSLSEFFTITRHLKKDDTRWVALKGKMPRDEMREVEAQMKTGCVNAYPVVVPTLEAERHVVVITVD